MSRLAVDVGGTFTDLFWTDDQGATGRAKALTTPADPCEGVVDAIRVLLHDNRHIDPAAIDLIVHGTTLVTNTVLTRSGSKTALVTTRGFSSVLTIGKETRFDMYDLFFELPTPLVPMGLRFELTERTFADGTIGHAPDEAELARLAERLDAEGVEAVAVCLLHSYVNPANERRVRELLLRKGITDISLSSEVDPQIGEYERMSTTLVNAYVKAVTERYLGRLQERLRTQTGLRNASLRLILSNGGLATPDYVRQLPVAFLESGPVGAVLAASLADHAAAAILGFDMGGTTAKLASIESGSLKIAQGLEVDRLYRFKKGSGLPVRVPTVELVEIGAGGGSIAAYDQRMGLLNVGPASAEADPGPACYGRGGQFPTVTDADLILGYVGERSAAGLRFDREAAWQAIERHVARPMGVTVLEAALAIHQLVNENMANAAKEYLEELGHSATTHTLFVSGGAGPLHAWGVGAAIGCPDILIPPEPAVQSAKGFLASKGSFEFVMSLPGHMTPADWARLSDFVDRSTQEGERLLAETGTRCSGRDLILEMRYRGQLRSIPVALGGADALRPESLAALREHFVAAYRTLYERTPPTDEFEIVGCRVQVNGSGSQPSAAKPPAVRAHAAPVATRDVYVGKEEVISTPVYWRGDLDAGFDISGPCLIDDYATTIVVGPGATLTVEPDRTVRIRLSGGADTSENIRLQVFWNRLRSITDSQAMALVRQSFTPIVSESEDLSACLFDAQGRMVAQSLIGTPGHINSLATCVGKILAQIPAREMNPGDVIMVNTPTITSGHKNDVLVLTPIFGEKGLIAFIANNCHSPDIGGRPGSPSARDVFEEGLHFPPIKLMAGGKVNETIVYLIEGNVRNPRAFLGDLFAQISANEVGIRKFRATLQELGIAGPAPYFAQIIERSLRAARAAVAQLPAGTFEFRTRGEGVDSAVCIVCRLTVREEAILIDFAGSSPQSRFAINSPLNYTAAYASYAAKVAIFPDIPNNAGSLSVLQVIAPEGSIFNPRHPAATGARQLTGSMTAVAVLGALSHIIPERVMAQGMATPWWLTFIGHHGADAFLSYMVISGGTGARSTKDGLTCVSFPARICAMPVEVVEAQMPMVVESKTVRCDSGGPGLWHGGCGQTVRLRFTTAEPVRVIPQILGLEFANAGLAGGQAGATGIMRVCGRDVPAHEFLLAPGEILELQVPGGGGIGDPKRRSPRALARDIAEGFVSAEAAQSIYGYEGQLPC